MSCKAGHQREAREAKRANATMGTRCGEFHGRTRTLGDHWPPSPIRTEAGQGRQGRPDQGRDKTSSTAAATWLPTLPVCVLEREA